MAFHRRYIAKKGCKADNCDNMPELGSGGYCWKHKKQDPGYERKEAKAVLKKEEGKIKMLSIGIPDDKLVPNTAASDFQLLQNWFAEKAKEIASNPVCMECNSFISYKYYRAATAHILPKKIFVSISNHPMNYLILCAKNGCHDKTHRLDTFSKMKVFPEAVRRFMIFYPDIKEKNKLLNDFIDYINKSTTFQP